MVLKKVKYYNEKVDIIELWQKLSDDKRKTKHANIYDVALKRIGKYCSKKKQKTPQKKKKKNTKHFSKMKKVFSLLKNLHVI